MAGPGPEAPTSQEKETYLREVKFLSTALKQHPHFLRYLEEWVKKGRQPPEFHVNLRLRMKGLDEFNFIYPVKPPDFIHAYKSGGEKKDYLIIEPQLSVEGATNYNVLLEQLRRWCATRPPITTSPERFSAVHDFLRPRTTTRRIPEPGWLTKNLGLAPPSKIYFNEADLWTFALILERELSGRGPLTPLVCDPYLNELNAIGAGRLEVVHKVWGTMEVGKRFKDAAELDAQFEREAARPGPTLPPGHPLSFRTSRGKTGIIHR